MDLQYAKAALAKVADEEWERGNKTLASKLHEIRTNISRAGKELADALTQARDSVRFTCGCGSVFAEHEPETEDLNACEQFLAHEAAVRVLDKHLDTSRLPQLGSTGDKRGTLSHGSSSQSPELGGTGD